MLVKRDGCNINVDCIEDIARGDVVPRVLGEALVVCNDVMANSDRKFIIIEPVYCGSTRIAEVRAVISTNGSTEFSSDKTRLIYDSHKVKTGTYKKGDGKFDFMSNKLKKLEIR